MRSFNIPIFYESKIISRVKELRRTADPHKRDYSPTLLNFGYVKFYIARHFGFCYGVENAIEISFRATEENPDKRIFLLSQMIHNPKVNNDLSNRGIKFLMDTSGNPLIPFEELKRDDIVIIPAFGTTLQIEKQLIARGTELMRYNTTCPFVERVWKKAKKLGEEKYTIIIHGKYNHEETRATFSRSEIYSPSLIIKNIHEAKKLGGFISGRIHAKEFHGTFSGRTSPNFSPQEHLHRIGIINQTTMLATETQEISDCLKQVMIERYGKENIKEHFADTRDTLCYATNENQQATLSLLEQPADLAIVVGGYNSSNTSHIVELCEKKNPTYFISSEEEIISKTKIRHFDFHQQQELETENYLQKNKGNSSVSSSASALSIILTSGASCPDAVVERVMMKIVSFFKNAKSADEVMKDVNENYLTQGS